VAEGAVIRRLDMVRDLDALFDLGSDAFATELERRGVNLLDTLREQRRVVPWLRLLGRVSSFFRDMNLGYVCEMDGRLAGVVQYGRVGGESDSWDVGTVATARAYRRQGIARRLVMAAVRDAADRGARLVTLKVREDNAAACGLYRGLGFEHYNSSTALKLERLPVVHEAALPGVVVRRMKLSHGKLRFDLARRVTPAEVQEFAPLTEAQFRRSWLIRLIAPAALRLSGVAVGAWMVGSQQGTVVATLRVLARRLPKMTHEVKLVIDGEWETALAEPLLCKALAYLSTYPRVFVETEIAQWEEGRLPVLERYGFQRMETWHWLGLRTDNA